MSYEDKLTYYSIEKVATIEQLEEYLSLNPDQRGEWLRKFWKNLDPTPGTDINEFKEEHERRVEYALTNFKTIFGNRPWDERGEVYILYGEPDERSLTIEASTKDYKMGERNLDERSQETGKREKVMREKMDIGVSLDTEEEFYKTCGEVWTYDKYNLTFQFEDEHFVGYYTLVPYTKFDGTTETAQEVDVKKAIFVEKQRELYQHDYGGEALDFAFDLLKFRGEQNDYDIDLNLGLPLDNMVRDDSNNVRFLRRITILDEELNQVATDSIISTKPIDKEFESGYLLIEQWQNNLPPGKYTLALEVKDLNSKKIGIYKKEFILPAYAVPGTQEISNLAMASMIRPAKRFETKYVRHGLVVLPMPSRVYSPDEMVYFYYEVYNLKKDDRGKTRYTVQYSLVDYKNKKEIPFYEPKTFEEEESDIFQHARIDAHSVPPGEYALVVRVTDVNRNKEKVTLAGFKIANR
ncbi:MAG: GWxTD domain-containing protein [candidate division Zixibacteria bacterium]|nr:GWxTD domain-containing protein [candidate division Zixibacteria bacterium]